MSVHHVMNSVDQKVVCPYCGKKTSDKGWSSLFDCSNFHYKTRSCECGRISTIPVGFMGSGHDSWNKDLDMRIEEADSESQKK